MHSAILDKGEKYYTHLLKIFNSINNEQLKYNWLITNCECYPSDEKIYELFSQKYIWLTGEKLTEIVNQQDFQFIWGVFSAFPKDITFQEIIKYDLPFADNNPTFITDDVKIQHPLAVIEIVSFDSSFVIFMSKEENLVDLFSYHFPLSKDLVEQNKRDNAEISHVEDLLKIELFKRSIDINEQSLHKK